jgi:phospholipase/carboxylesterase
LIEAYPIDANHISLIGFSQAILSYAVALSYPEKVQKVVAMRLFESRNHSRIT